MSGGSGPAYGERVEYGPDDFCYRHPKVHSLTLCQRCGRTICPECQTVSPVGMLCPDCAKQAQPSTAKRAGRATRATGRRIATAEAPVTLGIIVLCVIVYAGQLLTHYFGSDQVTLALWYAPLYSLPPEVNPALGFEPWRMLTAMFTHSTGFLFHIVFNMYTLWLFGRNLERMIGRAQFLTLYLFAGVGGALGVMFWVYADPSSINIPTVGASGAIFGVLGATLVAYRAAGVSVKSLAVMIAINFGIGLLPNVNISWQAHLGGLLIGAATMGIMFALRSPAKKRQRVLALCGLGVVIVLLSCAYFVVLPNIFA